MVAIVSCVPRPSQDKAKLYNAYFNTGLSFLQAGDFTSALENLLKAEEIRKNDPKLYDAIGLAYFGKGLMEKAEDAFNRALKLNPDYSEARNHLGLVYYRTGRYDQALSQFRIVLADVLYPVPEQVYLNMGLVYYAQRRYRDAIFYFRKSLQKAPNFPMPYLNLGLAYYEMRKYKSAKRNLKKAINLFDEIPSAKLNIAEAYFYLGKIYLKEQRHAEAKKCFKRVVELAPATELENDSLEILERLK